MADSFPGGLLPSSINSTRICIVCSLVRGRGDPCFCHQPPARSGCGGGGIIVALEQWAGGGKQQSLEIPEEARLWTRQFRSLAAACIGADLISEADGLHQTWRRAVKVSNSAPFSIALVRATEWLTAFAQQGEIPCFAAFSLLGRRNRGEQMPGQISGRSGRTHSEKRISYGTITGEVVAHGFLQCLW